MILRDYERTFGTVESVIISAELKSSLEGLKRSIAARTHHLFHRFSYEFIRKMMHEGKDSLIRRMIAAIGARSSSPTPSICSS